MFTAGANVLHQVDQGIRLKVKEARRDDRVVLQKSKHPTRSSFVSSLLFFYSCVTSNSIKCILHSLLDRKPLQN